MAHATAQIREGTLVEVGHGREAGGGLMEAAVRRRGIGLPLLPFSRLHDRVGYGERARVHRVGIERDHVVHVGDLDGRPRYDEEGRGEKPTQPPEQGRRLPSRSVRLHQDDDDRRLASHAQNNPAAPLSFPAPVGRRSTDHRCGANAAHGDGQATSPVQDTTRPDRAGTRPGGKRSFRGSPDR